MGRQVDYEKPLDSSRQTPRALSQQVLQAQHEVREFATQCSSRTRLFRYQLKTVAID
jgi:hypothetical protein